jgi:DUF4097 and DUF4098 domain-containing protein YvlB
MQTFVFTLLLLLLGCQTGGVIMDKDSRSVRRGVGVSDFEKAVGAAPGRKLHVQLETGGAVALSGWDRGEVAVTARLGGPDGRDAGVELSEAPDGVLLVARYNGSKQSYATSLSFDVKVPRRFDVLIESSGGAVTLDGLEGDFSGHTNGGGITLSETKGRVDLSTGGGNITLARSELSGRVSTGGGNIIFKGVEGDVQAHTGGGSVIHQDSEGGGAAARDAGGGGVKGDGYDAEVEDAGGALRIRKAGGSIEIADAPEGADLETGGGRIHVGAARRFVRAQTGGGEIVIDSVDGWVQATTGAGDVRVTLTGGEGRRDVTISSSAGDVTLVAPPDFSARFDLKLAYTKEDRPYRIDSDFAVEQRATDEWSTAEGTARKYVFGTGSVGGGRGLVKIQTVNGSIHVRKGR